jgi:hypothetical protein
MESPSLQQIKNAALFSKNNNVGINGELDDSSGSAIPAGAINGLDEIAKRQCLLLVIGSHVSTIRYETPRAYGVFTPSGLPSRCHD